jgi:hypothetical protein
MKHHEAIWPSDDPQSALIREVYARYGLAMYMSQVLEHAIVNALLVLRLLPTQAHHQSKASWESSFDEFYASEFRKTFGNMLKTLENLQFIPSPLMQSLRAAKKTRDILAHSFFRDYDLQFMTETGQVTMIHFCEKAVDEFKVVDAELDTFCSPFRIKFGLTDEWVEEKYTEMLKQAERDYARDDLD